MTQAATLIAAVLAFCGGAALMLTALRPRPGLRTYCVKCGCDLTDGQLQICPKCRRLLSDELRVTCAQSAILPGRFLIGGAIVAAAAFTAVYLIQ